MLVIVLIVIVGLCGLAIGAFFISDAVKLNKLSKLKLADSPTAGYRNLIPSNDEIFRWIEELTNMGVRQPGTKAGEDAANYVADKFAEFGLTDIKNESANTFLWTADDWGLSVNGVDIDSYYMSHTFVSGRSSAFSTPEGGLQAEIVYVGDGKESDYKRVDVKGKIVVSNVKMSRVPIGLVKFAGYLLYDPNKTLPLFSSRIDPYSANNFPYNYYNAIKNGAVGFIGILSNYIDSNQYNNENYSYIGGPMGLPGLWVSKSDGETLKNLIGNGEAVATMVLKGERKRVKGNAVVAYLPGKSDETILVHSHHDSSTTGAVEDASGTSVVLALAKMYAQIPKEERAKSLIFASMDSHFTGYQVHDAFAANHLKGKKNILVDVCVEHIANEVVENENGETVLTGLVEPRLIFVSGSKELINITEEEVVRHNYERTAIIPASLFGGEVPTDADVFYLTGIPIVSLVSGPIYLYDNIDTIDKVAKNELRPTTEVFADIIWRLSELTADEIRD